MANFKFQISNLRLTTCSTFSVLLLSLIVCSCSEKTEPIEDVEAEKRQMRIISMAPNLTEILFAIGLDEEIVGVTRYSTYPEKAKTKTNVGTFWQPDIEAVLACKPTLVVTLGFDQQATLAKRLDAIGCHTLSVNIETIPELYKAIKTMGTETGKTEESEKLIAQLKSKQAEMAVRYQTAEKLKVLWVVQREPLRVAGTETFVNDLIKLAGGINAIGDTINVYPPISNEELIGSMADVIIEPAMDMDQFEQQKISAAEHYQRFDVIPAVRNKRIYVIDGDLVSRLSPRLDEAMEAVSKCLWPEEEIPGIQ